MEKKIIWFDPDEWPDANGVLLHGGLARDAGTEICFSSAADRETELVKRLAEKGFRLFFEGDDAAFPWYGLPRLYVFARDAGGFYAADQPVDLETEAAIFYIDGDGHMTRAAASLRELTDSILAGEAQNREEDTEHRLFSSWREAEAAGELFLRNDTPWKRGKKG